MPDLAKLMPLLVSMRAMCDALLLEIAEEQKPRKAKGLGLKDVECTHDLWPGMGPIGVCKLCGETVAREGKDE